MTFYYNYCSDFSDVDQNQNQSFETQILFFKDSIFARNFANVTLTEQNPHESIK